MIVTFYSNYLTHHQIPFCNEMSNKENVEFYFISTIPMDEERALGGWEIDTTYDYELRAYASDENEQKAMRLARVSDVMIIGSAPERYVKERMKRGEHHLTLRYSERIYKKGYWRALSPRGMYLRFQTFFRYCFRPIYMLCASAYTAGDLAILGSYVGRCYKWGYFPEVKEYRDIDAIIKQKKSASILWVARFIDWKHPEIPVFIATKLKEAGYIFELNMIGCGEKEEEIRALILENDLQDCVHLLGVMNPEQVREKMVQSQVFLFTSDRTEGWGAVLNEAMNSACATVACDKIGSVPFLIQDGNNGLVYHNMGELYQKVKLLLDDSTLCKGLGKSAYETIINDWCASTAADRLLVMCEAISKGGKGFFDSGICSKAEIMCRRRGNELSKLRDISKYK